MSKQNEDESLEQVSPLLQDNLPALILQVSVAEGAECGFEAF